MGIQIRSARDGSRRQLKAILVGIRPPGLLGNGYLDFIHE